MEKLKVVYPIKFNPILKSTIWGGSRICSYKHIEPQKEGIGESWEISIVPKSVSVIANGEYRGMPLTELIETYGAEIVGKENLQRFGKTFPLLIKFIDACDDLSIQVHPTDELAEQRHHCKGKTEMWYVLDADDDATLFAGLNRPITADEYVERVANNTITDVLALHHIKKGDVFFLPAGDVHAIRKGTFIAEIQQSSDITYRIYDYDRRDAQGNARELHTELAIDAINYNAENRNRVLYEEKKNADNEIVSCDYFTTDMILLDEPMTMDYSDLDSFVVLICLEGACSLICGEEITLLQAGETVLLPAVMEELEIVPDGMVRLLETFV